MATLRYNYFLVDIHVSILSKPPVAAATEEAGSSSVMVAEVTDGVDRAHGGDLECFGMKNETGRGGLLFIGSKLLEMVLKLELLLIVLKLISIDSDLKPLLMKILSAAVQD
jgi:hypothetical protein